MSMITADGRVSPCASLGSALVVRDCSDNLRARNGDHLINGGQPGPPRARFLAGNLSPDLSTAVPPAANQPAATAIATALATPTRFKGTCTIGSLPAGAVFYGTHRASLGRHCETLAHPRRRAARVTSAAVGQQAPR